MLIANCVTRVGVPVVVDTACDWVKPIYQEEHDIVVISKPTKKDLLSHNLLWRKHCSEPNLP
nr:hypothetical protein [Enterobacter roggenkampii]